ncbi:MAG: TetR/AcrR family transcriptional regulator [Rectinema subterraneum]|uniref:TetR/AcrR family transcriptional regulator n=1 Tax=Rectinema subterraneum TaxID=2653714 RepID=UPI003C7D29A7
MVEKLPLSKRKLQARETRKRILESALSLFREKGFDQVSIDEITSAAGVSKGSFYTYFQTKSDIIIEEFRLIDDYYQKKESAIMRSPDAASRLIAFTKFQLDYIRKNLGFRTLSILYINQMSVFYDQKILANRERTLVRLVSKIIADGQASGHIRQGDPIELAEWMNRSMRGFFLDWAISKGSIDIRKDGMRFFSEFVLPALLAYPIRHS